MFYGSALFRTPLFSLFSLASCCTPRINVTTQCGTIAVSQTQLIMAIMLCGLRPASAPCSVCSELTQLFLHIYGQIILFAQFTPRLVYYISVVFQVQTWVQHYYTNSCKHWSLIYKFISCNVYKYSMRRRCFFTNGCHNDI